MTYQVATAMSAAAMAPMNTRSDGSDGRAVVFKTPLTNAIPGAISATIQVVGESRPVHGSEVRRSSSSSSAPRGRAAAVGVAVATIFQLAGYLADSASTSCSPRAACCQRRLWIAAGPMLAALALAAAVVLPRPHIIAPAPWRRAAPPRCVAEPPTPTEQPDEPPPTEPPTPARKGLGLWSKVRSRVEERDDDDEPVVVGAVKDASAVFDTRKRRLNARLGTSLKEFKTEVLDEVDATRRARAERRARLKEQQEVIKLSLESLREDILADIEEAIDSVEGARELLARTGERVFNDVEEEVRELIEEAQAEVNIAVADIEEAIELEGDKWKSAIDRFESQWLSGGRARRFDTLGSAGGSPGPGAEFWKSAFATDEIEAKIRQIRSEVREVQAEVDDGVLEIRQRWNTTSERLER